MHVYVITNHELGWDCVCGVVNAQEVSDEEAAIVKYLKAGDNYSDEDIEEILADNSYIAHYEEVLF